MNVRHIDHVNLTVADFDATVEWYDRVFGFDLVEVGLQDGHRWGVIRTGDVMMCLYEHKECRLEDRFSMREMGLHGINHFGLRITEPQESEFYPAMLAELLPRIERCRPEELTDDDIDYIKPYLSLVNISPEQAQFVRQGGLCKRGHCRRGQNRTDPGLHIFTPRFRAAKPVS